jgi:hypothetical protein
VTIGDKRVGVYPTWKEPSKSESQWVSRKEQGDTKDKHEDGEKDADDELFTAAFHHEDGDHRIEHCDDHQDEGLEIILRLIWHLEGWTEKLVVEELLPIWWSRGLGRRLEALDDGFRRMER